jgi:hypothetical protein
MVIKQNIFHSKARQILPKWGFWFDNNLATLAEKKKKKKG